MDKLNDLSKELQEATTQILDIIKGKTELSAGEKKEIVTLFVKVDKLKKSIISLIFSRNGQPISARDRILEYLKESVGKKVSGPELSQVGSISEFARRIRELRNECGGWQISTGMNRPDLKPDEYVLETLKQKPEFERMTAKVWAQVLERDNFTCQKCGWKKGDKQTNNRKFLEVHHKNPVRAKGKPEPNNLITLCNVCHDAQEAIN